MPPWVRLTSRSRRSALLCSETDSSRRLREISVPSLEHVARDDVRLARDLTRFRARLGLDLARLLVGLLVDPCELLAPRLQQALGLRLRLGGDPVGLLAGGAQQLLGFGAAARGRV